MSDYLKGYKHCTLTSQIINVNHGIKPVGVEAVLKRDIQHCENELKRFPNVKYHIEVLTVDEWNAIYFYKDEIYKDIIKDMPDKPETAYEHYVLGKMFGYGEREIIDFIKARMI